MRVKAVLFDLFDTLLLIEVGDAFYPSSLRRLYEFLAKNGVKVRLEDFEHVYFEVREKILSESRKTLEEPHFNLRVSQTLKKLGYNLDMSDPVVFGATMAFAAEFMRHVSLDPDAFNVLRALHERYRLGLVSNFGIPECARKLLEEFHLNRFLDVVIISSEVNRRKPSPEIFEKALKALGVEPSEAVFVGDSLDLDVMGPKNVGMRAVLIKRRLTHEIGDIKPDRVIDCLSELPALLEDL